MSVHFLCYRTGGFFYFLPRRAPPRISCSRPRPHHRIIYIYIYRKRYVMCIYSNTPTTIIQLPHFSLVFYFFLFFFCLILTDIQTGLSSLFFSLSLSSVLVEFAQVFNWYPVCNRTHQTEYSKKTMHAYKYGEQTTMHNNNYNQ